MHAIAGARAFDIENYEVDYWAERLMADGYAIIPDVADPLRFNALYHDLDRNFAAAKFGTGAFYGQETKRFARLLSRSPHAAAFVQHELVFGIIERILKPHCETIQLNLTQAIEIHPGAPAQFPHRDHDMWRAEKGKVEYMINAMWALDDFTTENGATRVWPGSNRADQDQLLPDEEAVQAVMKRGSVLLFLGSTLHSGGANVSSKPRRGMIISYCQGWLKPWENQWLAYPPEVAATFSRELASLIGYQQHAPTLGNYEGQCPSVLLNGRAPDHLAFTDVLREDQHEAIRQYTLSNAERVVAA